ncbi:hypothetical protein DL96DRAFT_1615000 [Flagelloscypha sp. PMI_526]|nr:hypothetical protein DL96DRAFT_1615000 [Flagelloscypha sp. PMI_526]
MTSLAMSSIPLHLTHLSASFSSTGANFSLPIFARLTHLDLSDFDLSSSNRKLPDLRMMSSLQVVVLGGEMPHYATFWAAQSLLPPQIETIIWFINTPTIAQFQAIHPEMENIAKGEIDARIVVFIAEMAPTEDRGAIPSDIIEANIISDAVSCFSWRSDEGTTVWELAEGVKRRRIQERQG